MDSAAHNQVPVGSFVASIAHNQVPIHSFAGHPLAHPIILASIAVLILNDHVLKAAWPGTLTGKLSDVAGLMFFPLVLVTFWELLMPRQALRYERATAVLLAAIASALFFAAIKIWPPAGELYRVGLAALQWPFHACTAMLAGNPLPALGRVHLTADPSDLVTIPAVLVPIMLVRKN